MNPRTFPVKLLVLSLCMLVFFSTNLSSKQIPRPVKAGYTLDADKGDRVMRAVPSAAYDTFVVAEYDFESDDYSVPDPQGWAPVDLTAQVGTFFHVDNFNVPTGGGTQAIWCGARPSSV
jgi:hypothetical protein